MDAKDRMIMEETRRLMELEEAKAAVLRYRTIIEAQEKLIAEYRELTAILKQGTGL